VCVTVLLVLATYTFMHRLPSHAAGPQTGSFAQESTPQRTADGLATVRIGQRVYLAELSRTPADQARGLMFRSALAPDGGMLFVFSDETRRSFWMKNTLIPLDVIFITKDRRIDSFHTMSPCPGDPCPIYQSAGKVVYVLEVNAGEVARNRFKVGDMVSISIPSKKEAPQR